MIGIYKILIMDKTSKFQNSELTITRKNVKGAFFADLYHDLMILSWPKTIFTFIFGYFFINCFFAFLYWLDPNGINNSNGSFQNAFFFSVQTLATIGYGVMSPSSLWANILVTVEAVTGGIILALMSGVFYSKFALPKGKLRFTKNLLITNHNGKRTLLFRVANERNNQIVDTTIHMNLLRHEETSEGMSMRRFHDLKLVRSFAPFFTMSILVMHVIDETSPLYSATQSDDFRETDEVFVTLVGIDGTYGQNIHQIQHYLSSNIVRDKSFVDIMQTEGSRRTIDMSKFDLLK
jgi:inward rectifier potassium channel